MNDVEKMEDEVREDVKITHVSVRNVKRIKLVSVPVMDSALVVGGKNAQGKSSFIEAITYALGGRRLCPKKPIRTGAKTAEIKVTLDGNSPILPGKNVVTRSFRLTRSGAITSTLKIESEEGYESPEPQHILNDLIATATFDPQQLMDKSDKDQFKYFCELFGIDTEELDKKRASVYETRTVTNRKLSQAKAKLAGQTIINEKDVPDEVDVSDVIAKRDELFADQRKRSEATKHREQTSKNLARVRQQIADLEKEAADLHQQLNVSDKWFASLETSDEELAASIEGAGKEIAAASKTNELRARLKREMADQAALRKQVEDSKEESDRLSDELYELDHQRARLLADVDWPMDELSFSDANVVTFQGEPLSQASTAQQIAVACSIELAKDRPLPVMIIKNGSILDEDHRQLVARIVAEKGGQVFVEVVGDHDADIVMEDGELKEVAEDE